MNHKEACEILEIPLTSETISLDIIKKQYRLKALLYHPDKNSSPDASSKFQEIHDAYEYLMKYNDYSENRENPSSNTYQTLLFSFLKNILGSDSRNQLFYTILQRLSNSCEEKTLRTLEQLDKGMLVKIYEIMSKYRNVLHFGEGLLAKIEEIIKDKIKNDECIILNPAIEDLFENNLYKLQYGNFTYIVPLWHHELVYDNSGNDVIVKCFPMLSENIYIDEMNNIHIEIGLSIKDIWGKETHPISIAGREYTIITKLLKLTKNQTVTFSKQGISTINTKDVYDVSKKGDVNIHIELSM